MVIVVQGRVGLYQHVEHWEKDDELLPSPSPSPAPFNVAQQHPMQHAESAVVSAAAAVERSTSKSPQLLVQVLPPTESVGDLDIIDGGVRLNSAVALDEVQLLVLSLRSFHLFFSANPQQFSMYLQHGIVRLWNASTFMLRTYLQIPRPPMKRLRTRSTQMHSGVYGQQQHRRGSSRGRNRSISAPTISDSGDSVEVDPEHSEFVEHALDVLYPRLPLAAEKAMRGDDAKDAKDAAAWQQVQ